MMKKKVVMLALLIISASLLPALACTPTSQQAEFSPQDLKVNLESVSTEIAYEQVLSDKVLIAKGMLAEPAERPFLTLVGMGEGGRSTGVPLPENVIVAMVPKASFVLDLSVTNPNDVDVILGSVSLGIAEQKVTFPIHTIHQDCWIAVPARETKNFQLLFDVLRVPAMAAMVWPDLEKGTPEWQLSGIGIVLCPEAKDGGWMQRISTKAVKASMK